MAGTDVETETEYTFTLTVTDQGEDFDVRWEVSPEWDGETPPTAALFLGGKIVSDLKEMLEASDSATSEEENVESDE